MVHPRPLSVDRQNNWPSGVLLIFCQEHPPPTPLPRQSNYPHSDLNCGRATNKNHHHRLSRLVHRGLVRVMTSLDLMRPDLKLHCLRQKHRDYARHVRHLDLYLSSAPALGCKIYCRTIAHPTRLSWRWRRFPDAVQRVASRNARRWWRRSQKNSRRRFSRGWLLPPDDGSGTRGSAPAVSAGGRQACLWRGIPCGKGSRSAGLGQGRSRG